MKDNINPEHYKSGGIETIEFIEAKMSKDEFYGYMKGNALKYISREGLKSVKITDQIDDIDKAIWFLEYMKKTKQTEIAMLEAKAKEDEWIEDSLHDED
jgi:hypothetical protein|tara:strand:- start:885 stop:1181 length:297 start_codon:yes stop_codon:yes gene_type:complete